LIRRHDWGVDLFLAEAEGLPFRDKIFDNVLHIGGINFFANRKKAIEEIVRVARPGGKIVIADEAERFARGINRSYRTSHAEQEGAAIETSIQDLISESMQDIQMDGIWKFHGKFHGYCLSFLKPG
jgi:ubiquinone/menaquinone biosynthesis C-methylase UbiE